MLVNKEYVLRLFNKIKKKVKTNTNRNTPPSRINFFLNKFPNLRNKLIRPIILATKFLIKYPKSICIQDPSLFDFITYPLEKEFNFNLLWFPKKDQKEIENFIRNRLLFLANYCVLKKDLFDPEDITSWIK